MKKENAKYLTRIKQDELISKWCYNHDMTYFIDKKGKHHLCDADTIITFDTKEEMLKYIDT